MKGHWEIRLPVTLVVGVVGLLVSISVGSNGAALWFGGISVVGAFYIRVRRLS